MKIFYLLKISFFFSLFSYSQTWEWAKNVNLSGEADGTSIGIDKFNNSYVAVSDVYYTGGGGGAAIYYRLLLKFNPSGDLLWQDTLDFALSEIVVNQEGECYVLGAWKMAKYNADGILLWLHDVPQAIMKTMTLMKNGEVVVSGINYLGYQPVFDSITLSGDYRFFMAKCDSSGNWLWAKEGGNYWASAMGVNENNEILTAGGLKIDENGNILGDFLQNLNISPDDFSTDKEGNFFLMFRLTSYHKLYFNGVIYQSSSDNTNTFVAKFDSTGDFQWIKHFEGWIVGRKIITDDNGHLYLSGSFTEQLIIDSFELTSLFQEGFIAKLDQTGKVLWIKTSEHNGTYAAAGFFNMALDNGNNLIGTGLIANKKKFDALVVTGTGYHDVLLAKINQSETSGINVLSKPNAFSIYPNPFTGEIYLKAFLSEKEALEIRIFDVTGKVVFSENLKELEGILNKKIEIQESPGLYLIEVTGNKNRFVKKVIQE